MEATSNSSFVPSGSGLGATGGGGSSQAVVAVARFNSSGNGFVPWVIVPVIEFLGSAAGRVMTGATLMLDGGEWMVP